jgi:hypothetical protein
MISPYTVVSTPAAPVQRSTLRRRRYVDDITLLTFLVSVRQSTKGQLPHRACDNPGLLAPWAHPGNATAG